MRRTLLLWLAAMCCGTPVMADEASCNALVATTCTNVVAREDRGDFRGLIAVRDQPEVLDRAAVSGTKAGCADCVWELILACPAGVGPTTDQSSCGAAAPRCRPGQRIYRLYLSTDATLNIFTGNLCLGGLDDVVPVGNIAAADIERYLRDLTPPNLTVATSPPGGTLRGLPTYFRARAPAGSTRPTPFGSAAIQETITIRPTEYLWQWGDGTSTGWTTDPGDRYPTGTLTHTYTTAGTASATLTTRWSGRYTITVDNRTFGPYDARGTVTRTQTHVIAVRQAHSTLVSRA